MGLIVLQYMSMITVLSGSVYLAFIEQRKYIGWTLFALGSLGWTIIGYNKEMYPLMAQGLVFICIEVTAAIRLYKREVKL